MVLMQQVNRLFMKLFWLTVIVMSCFSTNTVFASIADCTNSTRSTLPFVVPICTTFQWLSDSLVSNIAELHFDVRLQDHGWFLLLRPRKDIDGWVEISINWWAGSKTCYQQLRGFYWKTLGWWVWPGEAIGWQLFPLSREDRDFLNQDTTLQWTGSTASITEDWLYTSCEDSWVAESWNFGIYGQIRYRTLLGKFFTLQAWRSLIYNRNNIDINEPWASMLIPNLVLFNGTLPVGFLVDSDSGLGNVGMTFDQWADDDADQATLSTIINWFWTTLTGLNIDLAAWDACFYDFASPPVWSDRWTCASLIGASWSWSFVDSEFFVRGIAGVSKSNTQNDAIYSSIVQSLGWGKDVYERSSIFVWAEVDNVWTVLWRARKTRDQICEGKWEVLSIDTSIDLWTLWGTRKCYDLDWQTLTLEQVASDYVWIYTKNWDVVIERSQTNTNGYVTLFVENGVFAIAATAVKVSKGWIYNSAGVASDPQAIYLRWNYMVDGLVVGRNGWNYDSLLGNARLYVRGSLATFNTLAPPNDERRKLLVSKLWERLPATPANDFDVRDDLDLLIDLNNVIEWQCEPDWYTNELPDDTIECNLSVDDYFNKKLFVIDDPSIRNELLE